MSTHINAKMGDYADTVLLPGDPLRAKYIAENFLENVKQVNSVRMPLVILVNIRVTVFQYKDLGWEFLRCQFILMS